MFYINSRGVIRVPLLFSLIGLSFYFPIELQWTLEGNEQGCLTLNT